MILINRGSSSNEIYSKHMYVTHAELMKILKRRKKEMKR